MAQVQQAPGGLRAAGLTNLGAEHWNEGVAALYEAAVRRGEASISADGPLVCLTGQHTGRSPNDKLLVREPSSAERVWWGPVNRPLDQTRFDLLHEHVARYLEGRETWVRDAYAGADPAYRLPIRVVTEYAWHSLFARHMFIGERDPERLPAHVPEFTVIDAPGCKADPARHGTRSETFIVVNFAKRLVLIGGTTYAGEIKKSIFTVMNYLLPLRQVMPMHCSANVGPAGDVALFFGLSGTGKTTLSSDPGRGLIGDDEHGWSDRGVFNFEGGCYAKMIRLSAEAEPEIYSTTRRFGTVLENVVMDPVTHRIDLDDESLTENTRAAYPINYIPNASETGAAGHPRDIIMLTCDAFGTLPPISRLTPAQAMYHFVSGYTAKVAGTEQGVKEPEATFSTCFGAPFMPLQPGAYAKLLGEKIARHKVRAWLVNTGWSGGPYGVGSRMKLRYTRAMLEAALGGKLDGVAYSRDPIFGVEVPHECPDVPKEILAPRNTWKDGKAYEQKARDLAGRFRKNFAQFEDGVTAEVRGAGPAA